MNATEITAREQFIDDYTLIALNDEPTYRHLLERVKALEVSELALELESDFDEMVAEITSDIPESAQLLIRQLLIGQGADTWYALAKEISERLSE